MKQEELKKLLTSWGYEDAVLFENPTYCDAVIGISENGQVAYSYNKMVKHLMNEDNMTEEEAIEFIDYNTIRALPYVSGNTRPIVIYDDYFE